MKRKIEEIEKAIDVYRQKPLRISKNWLMTSLCSTS